MLKKLSLIAISSIFFVGCSTTPSPKYKISDADTQKWILEGNKAEQCLFPNEWKASDFHKLSDAELMLHQRYVYDLPLIQTITLEKAQLLAKDNLSIAYLNQQYQKFNHSNKIDFDNNWCSTIKTQYKQELPQVKAYIEQLKAQAIAKQKELERQRIQAEKERKAREAYLRTPAGQAELARQQQLAYQQQMLAQQKAYQQQMLAMQQQAAQEAEFQQLSNIISSGFQGISQNMQRNTQLINEATRNMRSSCQSIGNGWGATGGVSWNNVCY